MRILLSWVGTRLRHAPSVWRARSGSHHGCTLQAPRRMCVPGTARPTALRWSASTTRFRMLRSRRWPADGPAAQAQGVWSHIEHNHRCNCRLWKEEDQARRRNVPDSAIAANKRNIDAFNQRRNDSIEKIDECLLAQLAEVELNAAVRLYSESAGSMIDRLSIVALKVFHMRTQTE